MAADGQPMVGDATAPELAHRRLGVHAHLLDVPIVLGLVALADDGHCKPVQDGVAARQPEERRAPPHRRERVLRAAHLPAEAFDLNSRGYAHRSVGSGPSRARPTRRRVERPRELHAVRALVANELLLDALEGRLRVRRVAQHRKDVDSSAAACAPRGGGRREVTAQQPAAAGPGAPRRDQHKLGAGCDRRRGEGAPRRGEYLHGSS